MGVFGGAGLDAVDGVVEALLQCTDFVVVDDDLFALIAQKSDGGDDGGGAGGEDLTEGARFGGGVDLVDGELALRDLIAPVPEEGDDGVARDAGENGAGEGGGDDLVADLEEGVRGADLLNILMLGGIQPQDIAAVGCGCLLGGLHAACVVAAELGKACAAVGRADIFVLDIDLRGAELAVCACIVGTGGAENDDEMIVL